MKLVRHFLPPALAVIVLALAAPASRAQRPPGTPVPDTLDLKTAIGFALENNFAIRQARERIRQQEGVILEVSAQQIPNVSGTGSYQINDQSISQTAPPSHEGWTLGIVASQTVYAGGGVRSSIKSSRLVREAAMLDLKDVINNALLQVRTDFYSVLLTREKIKVQEENLDLLQQQLKTTNDRYEAGTVSSFEKLRAEVAVANAKTPLITARNDYRLAIEALRQDLGFAADTGSIDKVPEIVGTLDFTPQTFDLRAAFDSARANRPDLQRIAKLAAADEQSVTTARSGYYPNLAVVGGWELRKGQTESFNDSRDGFYVGLQSQWNIFDGRATRGRVIQAKSLLAQTKLALTERELAAEVEVRRAYSSWQEATELSDASKRVVQQAEEAVRLANARYGAGTGTQLDVLQVQVDLTTARSNQVQAFYNYNVAVASLREAMGMTDALVAESDPAP
jgi:outer membrane protein TolC